MKNIEIKNGTIYKDHHDIYIHVDGKWYNFSFHQRDDDEMGEEDKLQVHELKEVPFNDDDKNGWYITLFNSENIVKKIREMKNIEKHCYK